MLIAECDMLLISVTSVDEDLDNRIRAGFWCLVLFYGRQTLTYLFKYLCISNFFPQVCHFYLKAIMWNIRGIFTMCFICFAQNMAKMSWWVAVLKTLTKVVDSTVVDTACEEFSDIKTGWKHTDYWKSVIITWSKYEKISKTSSPL